jgi:hypothetical protein
MFVADSCLKSCFCEVNLFVFCVVIMAYVKNTTDRLFTKQGPTEEWGEPSKHLLQYCTESGRPVAEACWLYLHVTVRVRDTWMGTGMSDRIEDDGWRFYCSYMVDSWAAVRPTFWKYFNEHGLYHRASFTVEGWQWTEEGGWVANPHF